MIFGKATNDLRYDVHSYTVWHSMIRRCYSEVYQKTKPTYVGCEVAEEWLIHSNFKSWFDLNYVDDWQLDKDLLGNGKLYSKESCCFLPSEINGLFTGKVLNSKGVTFNKRLGKHCAQISVVEDGKRKSGHLCVGSFDHCVKVYKEAMQHKLEKLLNKYQSNLNVEAYNALVGIVEKG